MKTVTVPERGDLLIRLAAIHDEPGARVFHRVLAYNLAGKNLDGEGIAGAMAESMSVYISDHPTERTSATGRILADYVPALTEDGDVQNTVRDHLKAVGFFVG